MPGRLAGTRDYLANIGARRHVRSSGCTGRPQLCCTLRGAAPVYGGVGGTKVEVRWLRLPLQSCPPPHETLCKAAMWGLPQQSDFDKEWPCVMDLEARALVKRATT